MTHIGPGNALPADYTPKPVAPFIICMTCYCLIAPAYLDQHYAVMHPTEAQQYDPDFGDDRKCECTHPYYRHFDTYEDMYPIGCKYCYCETFVSSFSP